MRRLLGLTFLFLAACASAAPTTQPAEAEWTSLLNESQAIDAARRSLPQPAAGSSRRDQIELHLENQRKLETRLEAFLSRAREYYERTGDTRAARLISNERIRLGDSYMTILARHDRAIDLYRNALAIDPSNQVANERIALAESRRYASMDAFASIRKGASEREVARVLGVPREDWIKHAREDERLFTVWIFSRPDGGAAAVYFENGIVYHTNWNAAPAPADTP